MTRARSSAYGLAERCFELARSTQFEGERANAIARGIAIAENAKLSLDHFDIPGRIKSSSFAGEQTVVRSLVDSGTPFDWSAYQAELQRMVAARPAPIIERSASPRQYTRADISELTNGHRGLNAAVEKLYETLSRREAEVRAEVGESVYDARRRNFAAADRKLASGDPDLHSEGEA